MPGTWRFPPLPPDVSWLERLKLLDQLEKEHGADHLGDRHADDLLAALRPSLSLDERLDILEDGLKNIQDGRPPCQDGYPIAPADVRERVREWRKKWPDMEQREFGLVDPVGEDED